MSVFSIALGLNRPQREFSFTHYSTMLIPEWVNSLSDYARCAEILADAPGTRMPQVAVVDYSAVDSGLNPDDLHLISVAGVDRTANWEGLDDAAYQAKREGWLDAIVAGIGRSFPGFAGAVVQREMATAATMRHYLNTPAGQPMGFRRSRRVACPLSAPRERSRQPSPGCGWRRPTAASVASAEPG